MQLYTRSADPFEKIDDPTHHGAARDTIFPLEYSSAHMSRSILRPQRLIQGETVTSYMGGTPCERVLMKPFLSLMLLQSALVLPETVKGEAD